MNEIRHQVDSEALESYQACPQRYAYHYIYGIKPRPHTLATRYELAAKRTVLGIARIQASTGSITPQRASMVWQLSAKQYGLDAIAKWSHKGRATALWFQRFTTQWRVLGTGIEKHFPVRLGPRRVVDVTVTSDLVATAPDDQREVHILVRSHGYNPLQSLVGTDSDPWATWDLRNARVRRIPKAEAATGPVEQALRGMTRSIVWPYYDGRCHRCPYQDICIPEDSLPHRLKDESKRQRVRQRVEKVRSRGSI